MYLLHAQLYTVIHLVPVHKLCYVLPLWIFYLLGWQRLYKNKVLFDDISNDKFVIPTSFWAASACSTSDISLLFSRSLVAGVRWSSSRSGIFLVKKAWHWLRLTTLLVAYNNIVIWTVQYIRKIHISWFCHLHEDLILECGSKVFF